MEIGTSEGLWDHLGRQIEIVSMNKYIIFSAVSRIGNTLLGENYYTRELLYLFLFFYFVYLLHTIKLQ